MVAYFSVLLLVMEACSLVTHLGKVDAVETPQRLSGGAVHLILYPQNLI